MDERESRARFQPPSMAGISVPTICAKARASGGERGCDGALCDSSSRGSDVVVAGLASFVFCPTGLVGSTMLDHKKTAVGLLQPRRETLRGEHAGLIKSPPRLQL